MRDGAEIPLGERQRALLAALVLRARETVSSDALIEALWGEEAPPTARTGLQVQIAPAQPENLAPAHPGRHRQQPRRIEAVDLDVVEEGPKLIGAPYLHLGRPRLGRVGRVSHVADHEPPAHRIAQRPMQDRVDVAHRLRREAARGVAAATSQEVPVEGVELGRTQPLQLNRTQASDKITPEAFRSLRAGMGLQPDTRHVSGLCRVPTD